MTTARFVVVCSPGVPVDSPGVLSEPWQLLETGENRIISYLHDGFIEETPERLEAPPELDQQSSLCLWLFPVLK